MSWNDAIAYCNWLSKQHQYQPVYEIRDNQIIINWEANGYRLPTEAEWEFAARSRGKEYKYAWGNKSPHGNIADVALSKIHPDWMTLKRYNDGYAYLSPAETFEQGDLELFDITGNVWEWCWDWYDEEYYHLSSQNNPVGPTEGTHRVFRGGSWSEIPTNIYCFSRGSIDPSYQRNDLGFRLCRTAP